MSHRCDVARCHPARESGTGRRDARLWVALLCCLTWGLPAAAQTPLGTAFTYQGRLTDAGLPANGNYDLQFKLFDALTAGSQVGSTLTRTNVAVSAGLFTVSLDFGAVFTGNKGFLEIGVRPGGSAVAFTALAARQELTPSPNAAFAAAAASATSAGSATTVAGLSCTDNQVLKWSGTAWTCGADADTNSGGTVTGVTAGSGLSGGTISTSGTIAVSFAGSGSANTASRSDHSHSGVSPWVVVSGTSQLAAPNTGYIVTGATPTTINLPAAPVTGDVVRVSAPPGSGGFVLAPGAGQSIMGMSNFPHAWTPRDSARNWRSVASSADGAKLVAAADQIYTSTDSGVTWTPRDVARSWWSVASSADGVKLVAVEITGLIYTSTDSGVTWTPRESTRFWVSVASSADGVKLVALAVSDQIFTSTNSGATWTPRDSARGWQSVASSADGSRLVAVVGGPFVPGGGQIYTSTDSGLTWLPQGSTLSWQSVASSADGSKLVAVAVQIYTSTDSGATWVGRDTPRAWNSVASSADGTKLVASVNGGQIYTSADSGVTWTARDSARSWRSVASSADGGKLVGATSGPIYTWTGTVIGGEQFSTMELVYAGAGQWIVVNQQGITLR